MAKLALENGVNAVVEKPMATTYQDAVSTIESARKSKRFLTVFHNRRLDPWFQGALKVIEAGHLGKLFEINVNIAHFGVFRKWRALREASGGLMFDWGAHLVDWALHFDPSEVRAVSGFLYRCTDTPAEQTADHGTLRMHMASGAAANVTVSRRDFFGEGRRFHLLGEKGTLVDDWVRGDGQLEVSIALEGRRAARMQVPYGEAKWQPFYDNLADHMEGKAELMVMPESAARVVNVLCTAQRSSKQGGAPCHWSSRAMARLLEGAACVQRKAGLG
jgi:predicted dehydrogenase